MDTFEDSGDPVLQRSLTPTLDAGVSVGSRHPLHTCAINNDDIDSDVYIPMGYPRGSTRLSQPTTSLAALLCTLCLSMIINKIY